MRTLLKLTDPTHLSPDFVQKLQHYRGNGTVAKVNLALSGLPIFTALKEEAALKGRIHIAAPKSTISNAPSTNRSTDSFRNSLILKRRSRRSLTRRSHPTAKHVMSIYMQYAPYKLKGDWEEQRKALGQTVVQTLAQYAPNLPESNT